MTSDRAARVRSVLMLPPPERRPWAVPAAAIVAVAALLAAAAAQPVLAVTRASAVRTDVEAVFVVDTSRSMLARRRHGRTRLERARMAARRLRVVIPDVPVGIASLTDRVLPHLFPSADASAFATTLERAVGIERPPPRGFWTRATTFEPLADLVSRNFFSPGLRRRVVVVLTDGEARRARITELRAGLTRGGSTRVLFLRFWSSRERVFRPDGRQEPEYSPDPASTGALTRLAAALGAEIFSEGEVSVAARALVHIVGRGPNVDARERGTALALAPYLAAAALVPLALLVWRRNRIEAGSVLSSRQWTRASS